jgi:Peptidase_G2, IMC autoproteolytic cleavage domain/Phage tail-collar fibre protein
MSLTLNSVLTNAGITKIDTNFANATTFAISYFKIGDAFNFTPVASDTNIHGSLVYTGTAASILFDTVSSNQITIKVILEENVGPFQIGNIGLYSSDNVLIALGALNQQVSKDPNGVGIVGNRYIFNFPISHANVGSTVNFSLISGNFASFPAVNLIADLPNPLTAPYTGYVVKADPNYPKPFTALRQEFPIGSGTFIWGFDYPNQIDYGNSRVTVNPTFLEMYANGSKVLDINNTFTTTYTQYLEWGNGLNATLNTDASFRINIDGNNNGTGEYFAIGNNQTNSGPTNFLFKVQEDGRIGNTDVIRRAFSITSAGASSSLYNTGGAGILELHNDTGTPTNNVVGFIVGNGKNTALADVDYATIQFKVYAATVGALHSGIIFNTRNNNADKESLYLKSEEVGTGDYARLGLNELPLTPMVVRRDVAVNTVQNNFIPGLSIVNKTSSYTNGNVIGTIGWSKSGDWSSAAGPRATLSAIYVGSGSNVDQIGTFFQFQTRLQGSNTNYNPMNMGSLNWDAFGVRFLTKDSATQLSIGDTIGGNPQTDLVFYSNAIHAFSINQYGNTVINNAHRLIFTTNEVGGGNDPCWIEYRNLAANINDLTVVIGDDSGTSPFSRDQFTIRTCASGDPNTTTVSSNALFAVFSSGRTQVATGSLSFPSLGFLGGDVDDGFWYDSTLNQVVYSVGSSYIFEARPGAFVLNDANRSSIAGPCLQAFGAQGISSSNIAYFRGENTSYNGNVLRTLSDRTSSSGFFLIVGSANVLTDNVFRVRGDGQISSDLGTITTPADYAEMFEWQDGNPSNEDRAGMSVSLVNEKIKVAEIGEDVIGVISGSPAVLADGAELSWQGKFVVDIYNRRQEDENGNWAINPDFDPEAVYIPRTKRKEWAAVGLMGKLVVRNGQIIGSGWKLLKTLDSNHKLYLVK